MPLALDDNTVDIPVVLTPARLKQARTDVPATVSVITSDMIRQLGIKNLHEVFRLVPGMTVGVTGSNFPVLSYHGTKADEQRRLQVLIDGRSQYAPNLASVDWLNLPVPLEEIDRIEVTRGPNAAAYGANAFLATVNIITRHPEDTLGTSIALYDGSNGYNRYYLHHGDQTKSVNWRISGQGKKDNGFDRKASGEPARDSYDLDGANLSVTTTSAGENQFSLQAGFLNGTHEININKDDKEGGTAPDRQEQDGYASVKWQHDVDSRHFFHVQTYYQQRKRTQQWVGCAPAIFFSPNVIALSDSNQNYAAAIFAKLLDPDPETAIMNLYNSVVTENGVLGTPEEDQLFFAVLGELGAGGGSLVCGDINANIREERFDIELQDTITFSDSFRLVSGISLRRDTYKSQTYFGGEGANNLGRAFFNAEYRPFRPLLVNFGGMLEVDSADGDYFSPRLAFNYSLDENQSLRLVLSHAIRTPDTYEQSVEWSYQADNLEPALPGGVTQAKTFTTRSPGGLENEKIMSREIGYYMSFPHYGLETDIKIFRDNLWNLIGGPLQLYTFDPENNLSLTQTGAELEVSFAPHEADRFRLSYGYLDQEEEYTGERGFQALSTDINPERLFEIESRLNARNSGSATWQHFYGGGF
jgi:iron complex outermembrane receptor protein